MMSTMHADDDDGAGESFHDDQDADGSSVSSRRVVRGFNLGYVWNEPEGLAGDTPG